MLDAPLAAQFLEVPIARLNPGLTAIASTGIPIPHAAIASITGNLGVRRKNDAAP